MWFLSVSSAAARRSSKSGGISVRPNVGGRGDGDNINRASRLDVISRERFLSDYFSRHLSNTYFNVFLSSRPVRCVDILFCGRLIFVIRHKAIFLFARHMQCHSLTLSPSVCWHHRRRLSDFFNDSTRTGNDAIAIALVFEKSFALMCEIIFNLSANWW